MFVKLQRLSDGLAKQRFFALLGLEITPYWNDRSFRQMCGELRDIFDITWAEIGEELGISAASVKWLEQAHHSRAVAELAAFYKPRLESRPLCELFLPRTLEPRNPPRIVRSREFAEALDTVRVAAGKWWKEIIIPHRLYSLSAAMEAGYWTRIQCMEALGFTNSQKLLEEAKWLAHQPVDKAELGPCAKAVRSYAGMGLAEAYLTEGKHPPIFSRRQSASRFEKGTEALSALKIPLLVKRLGFSSPEELVTLGRNLMKLDREALRKGLLWTMHEKRCSFREAKKRLAEFHHVPYLEMRKTRQLEGFITGQPVFYREGERHSQARDLSLCDIEALAKSVRPDSTIFTLEGYGRRFASPPDLTFLQRPPPETATESPRLKEGFAAARKSEGTHSLGGYVR